MLGKLIKYDFKSLNRFLVIIHAFLLLSAVAVRIFVTGRFSIIADPANDSQAAIFILTFILYVIIITGSSFATNILVAVRFYKNLYSDEGYLTFTLPATRSQLLVSKTVVGTLWVFINQALIFVCLALALLTSDVMALYHTNKAEFFEAIGLTGAYADITLGKVLVIMTFFLLISALSTVTMLYASVSIGQLFSGHRVLGAVVAYFGLSTVLSIITYVVLFLTGLFTFTVTGSSATMNFNTFEYVMDTLKVSTVISLITSAILYTITYLLMKKKVNLS